ncbi:MAG: hypothetical protein NTX52_01935 [Planctomycetota bacterium]|nr:hypothetical protein [Planctomycetota bacterium]
MKTPNKQFHLTAKRAAGERRRSAVEVSIEKYEKTAMQWLQEQPQNN